MIRRVRDLWRGATYRTPPRVTPPPEYTLPPLVFAARPWAHWHVDPANCPTCRGWRPTS